MMPKLRAAISALAWNVTSLRRAQKLTIERAAWDAGVAPRHWSALEAGRGNPTVATLVKVAVALGADVRDLFAPVRP
jgi:XRE family transcriptional regulator, regulator of sulfur utilization